MAKRIRNNRFNVEWIFAGQCGTALIAGKPLPAVPKYKMWETDENGGDEKLIGSKLIEPQQVIFRGVRQFPEV